MVTWNDILTQYVPERGIAEGGKVESFERENRCRMEKLPCLFSWLFSWEPPGSVDEFPRGEIVSNLQQMLSSVGVTVKDKSLGNHYEDFTFYSKS